jgi:4-amino-4-deoxy-L-arabinose transferase-like glycosyltransferase
MKRRDLLWLLGILVIAAAVRLYNIHQPLVDSFAWREASTAMMADNFHSYSWNIFYPAVNWSGLEPGYQGREFQLSSFITALLFSVFGWHDWLGRVVSVAFSLLTVFSLHRLIASVWDEVHAHSGTICYAVMPGAAMIDRSFLPDPGMLALVTTGTWLFTIYLKRKDNLILLLSGLSFTIGVLCKLPGIGVGLVLLYLSLAAWILEKRITSRQFLVLLSLGAAVLTVVAAYYAWAMYLGRSYPPYHTAGKGYVWDDGIRSFASSLFYLPQLYKITGDYLTPFLLFLFVLGMIFLPPKSATDNPASFRWVFHVWFAGASMVFLMAAREITVNPWNLHVFHIPVAALSGRGLIIASGLTMSSNALLPAIFRIGVICSLQMFMATLPALKALQKPWAQVGYELGNEIARLSGPNEGIIAASGSAGNPVAIYYSRRRGWLFPPAAGDYNYSLYTSNEDAIAKLQELQRLGAKWFGIARNAKDWKNRKFFEHYGGLLAYLDREAQLVHQTEGFVIYRLTK